MLTLPFHKKPTGLLITIGVITELIYLSLYAIPGYHTRVFPFLGLFFIQFTLYFIAVAVVMKYFKGEKLHIAILIFSLFFHLTLLPSIPILEDDIYRYIWDGKMLINGINPYQYPPNSPELAHLRDTGIWPLINFKYIPTIYPPFSQVLFALAYYLFPDSLVGMKGVICFFNLLLIGVIISVLKSMKLDRNMVLIYAWNPLVLKETANSGHMDPFTACLLLGSILALTRRRKIVAAGLYALSILTKFYPLALLPFYYKRAGIKHTLTVFLILTLLYAPFLAGINIEQVFKGLVTYSKHWVFNPGLFYIDKYMFSLFTEDPVLITKAAHGLILGGIIIYLYKKDDGGVTRFHLNSFYTLGALIILSPVVNTWYLICVIPFLCVVPSLPWVLFTFLSFSGYFFFLDHKDIAWIRWTEYGIFYVALIVSFARSKKFSGKEG